MNEQEIEQIVLKKINDEIPKMVEIIVAKKMGRMIAQVVEQIFTQEIEKVFKPKIEDVIHQILDEHADKIVNVYKTEIDKFISANKEYVEETVKKLIEKKLNNLRMFNGLTFHLNLERED